MQSFNKKSFIVISSLILLSACSHVPLKNNKQVNTQEQLISVPVGFYSQNKNNAELEIDFQKADAKNWISQFNSSELETLIQTGLTNNPSLAITATRVLDSQVLVDINSSSRYPNLNAEFVSSRSKALPSSDPSDGFSLGVGSSWEIDLWGKLNDQTKSARINAEVSKQQLAAAELSLSANIAKAYFNLLTENELLLLAQRNTQNIQRIEGITVRSFKRGLVNALDVQLARRDLAASKQASLAQENSSITAARSLEVFLGTYPTGDLITQQALPGLPTQIENSIPANVLERRPDLQAAALTMLSSELDVQAARKNLFPSITLNGSAGTLTSDLKNIFDTDFGVWSILGSLTQPILNRKALTGNLQLEKNAQERAKLQYIDSALRAMNEVETTLATENSLRAQVNELTISRNYARDSSDQARQQYEKGLANANTLLSTETQYLNAEQSLLRLQNQLLQNRISLYVALGGDTETQGETP